MLKYFLFGLTCFLIGLLIGIDILIVEKTPDVVFSICDWFGNILTLTGITIAILGFNSWKAEKRLDLEKTIFYELMEFSKIIRDLQSKYRALSATDAFYNTTDEQIPPISDYLGKEFINNFNNIKASIRFYAYFTKKELGKSETIKTIGIEKNIKALYRCHTHLETLKREQNQNHYEIYEFYQIYENCKDELIKALDNIYDSIDKVLKKHIENDTW
ncbi:hypothetical protein [Rodentibacter caecimuris]|uniref:DUF4760 domain-containing protein n=1 Tax=Rodentibacter caecimuris TaxID=1796644 RepID=A0ABX3KVM7_9PAST|nr:hypothetical protein BKG89_09915 [Rodentibacter heylii]